MLSSEWRVKTSVIPPISVENLPLAFTPADGAWLPSVWRTSRVDIAQLPRDWFAIDSGGGDHETGKMEGRRHHYPQFNSRIYSL